MKTIYARQGDLIIDRAERAPVELKLLEAPVTIAGSDANGTHTLPKGVEYAREGRNHYVRAVEPCELTHATRHRPVPLEAGQLYTIYPQIERRGDGDVDVED